MCTMAAVIVRTKSLINPRGDRYFSSISLTPLRGRPRAEAREGRGSPMAGSAGKQLGHGDGGDEHGGPGSASGADGQTGGTIKGRKESFPFSLPVLGEPARSRKSDDRPG